MIESVKAHYVSTCHRLIEKESEREREREGETEKHRVIEREREKGERERDKERDKESGGEKVNGQRYGEMEKEGVRERQIKNNSCIGKQTSQR